MSQLQAALSTKPGLMPLVNLLAGLGIAIGGILGILVGVQAFQQRLNASSFDPAWVVFYAVLLAIVGGLCWFGRGRWLIALSLAAVAGFVLATVLRAGTGPAFAALVWLGVVGAALGHRLLTLLAPGTVFGSLERLILAGSIGLGSLALLMLGLGAAGLFYPVVAYALLIGLSLLLWPTLPAACRLAMRVWVPRLRHAWATADLRFLSIVVGLLAICLFGALVWAVAPSIQYDALNYHLSVPAIYTQQHALVEVPEEFRSYWAHNAEMLYTLALLLVGQPLPALIHVVFGLFTAGLVYSLGQRLGGGRTGLLAALLFFALPLVTWEAGTANIDLVVTLFAFASVYAAAIWWLEADDNWLTVAGVLAGLGMGTKLNMALVLLPLGLLLAIGVAWRYRLSRRALAAALRFGLPAFGLFAPWLLRDWLWTGNPIFPYYNAIFKSLKWPAQNTFFNFGDFGVGHGLADLLRLPWDLTLHATSFAEGAPPGVIGALPILALPWLYWGSSDRVRRLVLVTVVFALAATVLWFKLGQFVRYLLPLFPVFSVLAALNLERLWTDVVPLVWRNRVSALAMLIACGYVGAGRVVQTEWGWPIPERYPYGVALGLEDQSAFLSRTLPVYDAFQFLNQEGGGHHKVLSIGNEFKLYSTSRIFGIFGSVTAGELVFSQAPASILSQSILRQGFDYLLVDETQVQADAGLRELAIVNSSFLSQYTRLEFTRHQVNLYRLLTTGAQNPPTESVNLLTNGGFEQTDAPGVPTTWFAYGSPLLDRSGTKAHSGQAAAEANSQSGYYQRVLIEPGKLYTLGHWTRADQPGQAARLQINWLDSSLNIVDVSLLVVPVSKAWEWHEMAVTAPDRSVLAQVYISVQGESQVWFDDVKFIRDN